MNSTTIHPVILAWNMGNNLDLPPETLHIQAVLRP